MALIRQATLHYNDEQSTNIYEVDLLQVDDNLYIINYIAKYNQNLYSGEITTEDIPLEQAQQIFNAVIQQKTQEEYTLISDRTTSTEEARKQAVLDRLANKKPSKWKLERAIWRAGETQIKEAAPLLINLIGTGADLRDYCIAWALGLCGSTESIPALLDLYYSHAPEFVQRIAFEALLKLADAKIITNLKHELTESLPQQTRILARTTSTEIFTQCFIEHPYYCFAVLDQVYQLDNEYVRPALLNILRTAPFQPNYFHSIRRIFKIAEYRCDAEVFAILAYRFERTPGNFNNDLPAYSWDEEQGKYLADKRRIYSDEQQQDEPLFVYSYQTQQYLRRRVWRTLKALAQSRGADYINMATAVLLEYSDTDTPPAIRSSFDQWDYYQRQVKYPWDAYTDYLAFNHILYTNSQRYEFNYKTWRRRKGVSASFIEPDVREEAFPELWQQHPEALLKLLMNSKSYLVINFAVKVLHDCKDFCASLNINTIMELVYSKYQVIAVFAFELALQRSSVRQVAQLIFLNIFDNICDNEQELLTSVKWLESDWQDSRCFGTEIFTSILNTQQLTPKLIIRIADSDKEEARIVGEALLNRYLRLDNIYIISQATEFIILLLPLSKNPSVYSHLLSLLQQIPQCWAPHIDKQLLLQVLQAKLSIVQEFAVFISNFNLDYFALYLTTNEILTITNHDILSVREIGRQLFVQNLDNFRNNTHEILNAVRILESKWQDTRDFGFKIFTTEFSTHEFTPDMLTTICDSTNKEVRKLGRELLTRSNTGADSQEYLLKFSEHPSQDMQLFVTNYLDNAANNPQYLRALVPYFNTVLSSVNRNRGAKKRIFKFLEQEALNSEEAALLIIEVIERQVLAMAVGDKATAIQILLKIKKAYPHLNLPIIVQDVEERRKTSSNLQ